jgi:hypothetical protein
MDRNHDKEKSIILGSFPDKKSAIEKRAELRNEYRSANTSPLITRKKWDPNLEIIVKPSSFRTTL